MSVSGNAADTHHRLRAHPLHPRDGEGQNYQDTALEAVFLFTHFMQKDFEAWNGLKQRVHTTHQNRLYRERQVWWTHLGINIGNEEDGKTAEYARPVVIMKGFDRQTCLVVPLTTVSGMLPYCQGVGTIQGRESFALPYQIRCIDTKRFRSRIGFMNEESFLLLKKTLRNFF